MSPMQNIIPHARVDVKVPDKERAQLSGFSAKIDMTEPGHWGESAKDHLKLRRTTRRPIMRAATDALNLTRTADRESPGPL